ncbi:MAG TPA: alpha/beta hydrolase [Acholeplasma sp.]|nr:alpha/beta hydrolase [Acholeplasma sp.]
MSNYFNINGMNLYYEIKGDLNSNKVVAFFNGVMASTSSWEYVIPVFEKLGFKIILHDFKGQLRSDKPEGPYTFVEHASEAKALFDYLKIEKIHLIGTSYGSEVAMRFSLMYPSFVETLSIIDGVSELDEVLEGFINNWEYLLDLNDGEKFFLGMAPIIYGNRYYKENKQLLKERAAKFKKVDPSYFKGQRILYETFKNDVNMTEEIVKIKTPTLVIVGEDDLLKRVKFSEIIANTIPNTEYFVIPNCGHVAIFESPEELQTLLAGFIIKYL